MRPAVTAVVLNFDSPTTRWRASARCRRWPTRGCGSWSSTTPRRAARRDGCGASCPGSRCGAPGATSATRAGSTRASATRWSGRPTTSSCSTRTPRSTRAFLAPLVEAMEADPGAAIAGGTIYAHHDRTRVWYAGGRLVPWRGLAVHLHQGEVRPVSALGEPRPVSFVTGCMALHRVSLLPQIGEQDERFFLYLDDIELSARVVHRGYRLLYVPRSVIYHRVLGGRESRLKLYYSVAEPPPPDRHGVRRPGAARRPPLLPGCDRVQAGRVVGRAPPVLRGGPGGPRGLPPGSLPRGPRPPLPSAGGLRERRARRRASRPPPHGPSCTR